MAYAANETRILAGFEEFFSPRPARLWDSDEKEKTFVLRIDRITKRLGGPPKYILEVQNEPQTVYDTYAIAAFKEVISVFYAARKFVCRAHMLQIGTDALRRFPEAVNTENEEIRRMFQSNAEDAFWEHAENAFIKLCSYWDRVGQILDFIFFQIRQFDRDGFTSVMDRIRANVVPVHEDVQNSIAWEALRKYQTANGEDRLKWLLSRRNYVVHSLSLRLIQTPGESEVFKSAHNHLEDKLRRKLAPGTPRQEVKRLQTHLRAAAELFPHMLTLCEQGVNLPKILGS